MAEEAMSFIAKKYFRFDEDGTYIPYQKSSSIAPEDLDETHDDPESDPYRPCWCQSEVPHPDGPARWPLCRHQITEARLAADADLAWADSDDQDPTQTMDIHQYLSSLEQYAPAQDHSPLIQPPVVTTNAASYAQLPVTSPRLDVHHPWTTASRPTATAPCQAPTPFQTLALNRAPATAIVPPRTAAPVSGGRGGASGGQVTVGLGLVVNGKTYPKIEDGKERWYTQRPGHGNSYSRYSDLVNHDKKKGVTPLPRASKEELAAARSQHTFG